MELFDHLALGFGVAFTFQNLVYAFTDVGIGANPIITLRNNLSTVALTTTSAVLSNSRKMSLPSGARKSSVIERLLHSA